jgi:tryptophan-rich sensory protein
MFDLTWYKFLHAPVLTPSASIFPVVWGFLYFTILLAFVLYFWANDENKKFGYFYFFVQLSLNFLWTPVFFLLKNIVLAFVVIVLLDIFLVLTIQKFYKVLKISGLILIPYFLWVLFATYLNLGFMILN